MLRPDHGRIRERPESGLHHRQVRRGAGPRQRLPTAVGSVPTWGVTMDTKYLRALVGRDNELAELEAALDRLAAGEPWLVQVVGEPGIGKSRLLAELCRRGEDRGYLVLDGRAAEFERDIPFGLIVDALNDYLASLEPAMLRALDGNPLRELVAIFPALLDEDSVPRRRGEGAERYRLHYAIRSVLERLTERQPMVLALDDVHWADAASVEMLTHLLRRFRGPLLTAIAYRPAPTRLLAALEGSVRGRPASRIEPAALTAEEVEQLVGADTDEATRALLYRESGGNPFYVEQLARASRLQGTSRCERHEAIAWCRSPRSDCCDQRGAVGRVSRVSSRAGGCGDRGRAVRARADRRDRAARRGECAGGGG